MASAIPRELRSQTRQHPPQVIQPITNPSNLLGRHQFQCRSNLPLGFKLRVRSTGNAEKISEFTRIPSLTAFTDIADDTQAGPFHLIPQLAVPAELGKDSMCRFKDIHRKVINAKFMKARHI
jgi:hypothetical protein